MLRNAWHKSLAKLYKVRSVSAFVNKKVIFLTKKFVFSKTLFILISTQKLEKI